jgi:hypothetical protein
MSTVYSLVRIKPNIDRFELGKENWFMVFPNKEEVFRLGYNTPFGLQLAIIEMLGEALTETQTKYWFKVASDILEWGTGYRLFLISDADSDHYSEYPITGTRYEED